MKWMFKLIVVVAALWSGYWFIGAQAQEKMYASLLEGSRDIGWTAESRNLGVQGFPNRFDTTLTNLNFRDPSGKWGWQGEAFQLKALSYQPNHIIAAWDGEQVVDTPEGSLTINSELLRASVVVSPATNLPLERLQLEGTEVDMESSRHWSASMASLNGALHQSETDATQYRLGITMLEVSPPAELVSVLGGGAFLPDILDEVYLSAQLHFDREIDRLAFQNGTPPKPVSAEIETFRIDWGRSVLSISGELQTTSGGYVDGHLDFDVRNWEPLFEVFKQASHMSATEKLTLKRALDGASGGENLVFTVRFSNGESSIGPFTIGPAPRVRF